MPSIKVLPIELRNKIAAGEVIERPASVVKELIENAVDAGSAEIKIEVLNGGKRMIKVSDSGSGMDREDALLCLEPHATSKISHENDLFDIRTLGFRGEAIPSIASISKMKIVTGVRGAAAGLSIDSTGGEIREIKDSPFAGTSVEVRDLFFNTPPRKKFLKTDSTELFHIIDTVTREALAHYDIGITLFTDNHETMLLPRASGHRERIRQIYGDEFLRGLLCTDAEGHGLKLKAIISSGNNFRNGKSHQFIFINSRPVKDQALSHAVYKAYEGILPSERHPVFFLFLDIDRGSIDVNVHPTKREVRFSDKETVYKFVYRSLRDSVKEERNAFTSDFVSPSGQTVAGAPAMQSPLSYQSLAGQPLNKTSGDASLAEDPVLAYSPSLPFIYLGDTFIAVSGKGGLMLIDHHAAHERILYEKFLKRINLLPHHFLFPEQIKLSHKEYRVLIENKNLLEEFGIETDDFGHDTLIVRSVPDVISGADMRGILSDIATAAIEGVRPEKSLREALAARIACHASVRGSEILNQEEFSRLIADLENTEHPDQCPHGRPTRVFFTLDDLKKLFKRK